MKRNYELDLVRIFAIFLVIMAHVYSGAYVLWDINENNLPMFQLWSAYAGFTLGRVGVPLFLMLTGYFLLPRQWTEGQVKKFQKSNVLHLFITWEIWIAIYFLYNKFYGHISMGGDLP